MRIAYVCYWNSRGRSDGVSGKIETQLAHWRSSGHHAELFMLSSDSPESAGHDAGKHTFAFVGARARWRATRSLYAAVGDFAPDLVYLRYDLFVPPPRALTRLAPTVVEFNSNAQVEWANRSRATAFYERLQLHLLLARAAGAVCVAYELATSLRRKWPHLPATVISNGIDLEGVPVLPQPTGTGVRLAYLGEDVYWQGVDKLFALADALPDWHLDIIGVREERSRGNVTCHGYLESDQFEPILAQADIAVGTLALHRKQMNGTSAIKVQRYLAYGLPVIIGYEETGFVGLDPWYLLRLPNTETNVLDHLSLIRSFAADVKGRRVARVEVAGQISAAVKEEERLAFFADLVQAD
jgi:glycosyltransferase involved in cell wall biosynthesis